MTDLTTTVSLSGVTDLHYDDGRGLLYLTDSSGVFYRWNPSTGAYASSVTLGGASGDFDITANGQYALVARSDTGAIDRVDLSNLNYAELSLPISNPFSGGVAGIATTSSGQALATLGFGSASSLNIYQFSAVTSSISLGQVLGDQDNFELFNGYLASSDHHRYVLLGGENGTYVELYDSAAGLVTAGVTFAGLTTYDGDINEAVGLISETNTNAVYIFNLALHEQGFISLPQLLEAGAAEFSPDGHQLLVVEQNRVTGADELDIYDTSSLGQVGSFSLPTNLGGAAPIQMTHSADGRMVFLSDGSIFEAIDLSAREHLTIQGDAAHSVLFGSANADTLIGSAANDRLNGQGGGDTLTGGLGADVFIFTTANGQSVITDFSDAQGDKIDLAGLNLFRAFAAVQAAMTQSGSNTVISFGDGNAITLDNVAASSLTAKDFVLTPFKVDGAYTVAAGVAETFDASAPIYSLTDTASQTSSLTIAGSVAVSSSQAGSAGVGVTDTGLISGDTATLHIASGGSLTLYLTGPASTAIGYLSDSTVISPTILNEGRFDVEAAQQAVGAALGGTANFTNSGVFTVAGDNAIGITGYGAIGSGFASSAKAAIVNNGNFTVTGGSSAVGVDLDWGTVTNSGTISAAASSGPSVAIDITGTVWGYVTVTNAATGTITAGTAVLDTSSDLTLDNYGTINGDIVLTYGVNSIVNTGVIHGAVTLSSENNTLDSHAGTITGAVTLGAGFNTVTLGSENDVVIAGAAGIHVVDGGGGINTISYASSTTGVTISLELQGQAQPLSQNATDTLSNFQNVVGSAHNDILVGGGAPSTTLTGGMGADTFVYHSSDRNVTVTDFSHAQGDQIDLTQLSQFGSLANILAAATQNGADTVINTGSGLLTLKNVSEASLVASDFQLHPVANPTLPYPFSAVCLISDTVGSDHLRGSGVIIGPHTILTAAHMLWDSGAGQSATNITIEPGYQSGSGSVSGTVIHYNPVNDSYDLINRDQSQSDFAIIDVAQDLSSYGAFQVSTNYGGGPASITGYPGAAGYSQQNVTDTVTQDSTYSLLDYSAAFEVSPGSSGGPIWINEGTAANPLPYVVGIVSTDSWGAQLTSSDWTQIQGWIAQDSYLWPTTGSTANNYTATFEGGSRQYTIYPGGLGVTGGPENANASLIDIHRIQFIDGYETFSTADPAAEVYRLYEATLNRAPDPEGLTGWVNALNGGVSLQTVAAGFVSSAEFQADYGALDNSQFINLLYENVLHRVPDPVGQTYWLGQMSGGMTQAQVVLGFTQSPEDINDLSGPVQQGLWVGDPNAAEVARLYDTTLGRLPDITGLTGWTKALESGTSLQTVVNGFVGSAEFQADYGPLDNSHFVSLLYNNVLHRDPDSVGQSYWVGQLASNAMTRAQVVLGFSDSPEHIGDTAAHIDNGIWVV